MHGFQRALCGSRGQNAAGDGKVALSSGTTAAGGGKKLLGNAAPQLGGLGGGERSPTANLLLGM